MRVFILNSLEQRDNKICETIRDEIIQMGWEVNVFHLHDKRIAPCQGCYGCFFRTPGICLINDDGREAARLAVQNDLLIFLTPVTFGGYSSTLKQAVDRLIQIVLPFVMKVNGEYHQKPRYGRYPRLIGIGVLPCFDKESENIFRTLVARNAINLCCSSNSACVLGRDYTQDRVKEEVNTLFAKFGMDE
jgi:hypothetical protein